MITVNPNYFREAAIYYDKHGTYDDGIWDSYYYHEYWDRERERCLNGYSVSGMKITGYHYFYLNYNPIWKVKLSKESDIYLDVSQQKKGDRVFRFPDFWDVDYEFFTQFELAEENGEHFIWLKPRGVGASYKGSSMLARNFFLIPGSKGFMFAKDKTFLTDDGLFSKFIQSRQFINKDHPDDYLPDGTPRYMTAFGKPSDFKKDNNDMFYRASTNIVGKEEGYMSEVIGMTFNDGKLQKHRGKRGKLILIEEMGAFPGCETVYNVAKSSVEELDTTFGTILGFGTGGTEASDFGDMEKLFYSPETYRIRLFDNIYDEGMQGTKCAFFTPAYRNVREKDEYGNSNEEKSKKHWDRERDLASKSSDVNALIQVKAEHPYCPQEAILSTGYSVLPRDEAREWRLRVIANKLHQIGVAGELKNIDGNIAFSPNPNLKPIYEFPHKPNQDLTGAVVQYYSPFRINSRVPDDLYIIALDPYAFDQSTDSNSIGAAYVYVQPNNIIPGGFGDRIVATYFGRPKTTDDFNKVLFNLAHYYNAKIGFENDRGDTIGYAKRFKHLDWLAEEFELAFDADISKSKVRRQYGMHIGSGKENLRKHKGDKYLADWLITERGKDLEGMSRLNLHTIYCPVTLKEIETYRSVGGNFDRVSALRILAYYQKELVYKDINPKKPATAGTGFFNTQHFQ